MLLRWLIYVAVFIFSPDYVILQRILRNKRSNDYVPCEYGWFHFKGKCYRVGGAVKRLGWHESATHCELLGANLATIESKEENDFLVALVLLETQDSVWIGLEDRANESDYRWQSGSTSEYRNFRDGEPSGTSRGHEDCVELLVWLFRDYVGVWNDQDCGHTIGYICEKKSNPDLRTPNLRYCSSAQGGGFRFKNSCYHLVTVMKTWEEAEQHCIDNYGGHLITVLEKSVDYYLHYLLQSIHAEVWIGIKIRDQFQQKWTSGWFVGYNGFDKEIRDFIGGTCVVRSQRKKWNIVPCTKKHSFICETSKVKAPVLKPPVPGSSCPSIPQDWRDMDGEFCYYIQTGKSVSWYEANFQCMRRGGNLVSLHSKDESDLLLPFIQYVTDAVFIGLFRQYGLENTFRWTDGSSLNFVDWRAGEPNDENEKCVEARSSDMKWNDEGCNDERGYICSIRKLVPNITTTTENPDPGGSSDGTVSVKALIGVCLVLVVIVLGFVIYNFRPKFGDRKKIPSAVCLQPTTHPAPRQKNRSSDLKVTDQDSYYETMDS